jgi:hypothetical protein
MLSSHPHQLGCGAALSECSVDRCGLCRMHALIINSGAADLRHGTYNARSVPSRSLHHHTASIRRARSNIDSSQKKLANLILV